MTHQSAEAFCAEIQEGLVGALTLFCGDRGIAEEFAQEALVRAFQKWDFLEAPRPWTYATAFNLARSRYRRRQAELRATERVRHLAENRVEPDTATAIAVRAAVTALPDRQRQAVLCRFYGQLSVAETATSMRCAEGTVKSLTHQAITSLRRAGLHVDDHQEVQSDA